MTQNNQNTPEDKQQIREKLAAIEHERWADWQKWCHKVIRQNDPNLQTENVLMRWDKQIETPYADLSEKEKQSDREQVDRYWPIIESLIKEALNKQLDELEANWTVHEVVKIPLSAINEMKEGL